MAAYATVTDVTARMTRSLSASEESVCAVMLEDAGVLIDAYNAAASADAKKVVSCRMVIRALGDGETSGVPVGATQGSQGALGYTQSWTISGGGASGEMYIGRVEKKMLGAANAIGSYSPVQALAAGVMS